MNYLISEDEYNSLHAVQRQLNMMSRLCGEMKGFEVPCAPEDLSEFFAGQESAIGAVRKAIDHRHELTHAVEKPMRWMDWLTVMEIASGDHVPLHPNAVQYIDDALSHLATLEPEYEMVVKKWVEASARHARKQRQNREQAAQDTIKEVMKGSEPSTMSLELFADLMRAVSGQAMELDELNDTVAQFLAVFDEQPADQAAVTQAVAHALMHHGYEHSLTVSKNGHSARWVRKAEAMAKEAAQATATAPTVGKQRKRERTAKRTKTPSTAHMTEGAAA